MARLFAAACLVLAPCPVLRVQSPAPAGRVVVTVGTPDHGSLSGPRLVQVSRRATAVTGRVLLVAHPHIPPSHPSRRSLRATRTSLSHRKPVRQARTTATVLTIADVPQPWKSLAWCESGRDLSYRVESSSFYRGRWQFDRLSWKWMGGEGDPARASVAEQLLRARRLLKAQGWVAWPVCSRELGLR